MKIERIEAIPYAIPYARPLKFASGEVTAAEHVLVRIHTDTGICGVADTPPRPYTYGETQDSIRYQLRMFNGIGCVTDNPRNEYLAFRKLYMLPHAPLVLVTRIGGFNQVGAGAYPEKEVHNIL